MRTLTSSIGCHIQSLLLMSDKQGDVNERRENGEIL